MASEPLIRVEGVSLAFGSTKALEDLTFTVQEGEVFGFLGPSGAGKTTTIKMLTRQLRADGGMVQLFGSDIAALPQKMYDNVGVLSDNSGLYERLSVSDNLLLFANLHRLPRTIVGEALAQVGLAGEAKKTAKALSRGMKQRLMLARAVLHKPRLLFLDEPTASLDPATAQQVHQMLRELNAGGTTIFLTTHNMEEADKLCHRVAFLNHGGIAACDTPDALKLAHAKNRIEARTRGGQTLHIEKTAQALRELADALEAKGDALLTLHSEEPNLEEIFLALTGRALS
ncbi:MAG: ABC transporter ATP-binding protein [Oscillospiraceae bacterium]|jgi:ABC-2 type transport system ATP-binding protein|nr:ABC transporter ATP-binding protein [Oscillospiraceae bacterium]